MEEKKQLISFKDFISGSVAGIVQVMLGQPFDIIKVRMQTNSEIKSVADCALSILKKEGIKGFYRGTMSPLIGISAVSSLQFGAFEFAKNFLANRNKRLTGKATLEPKDIILSGMFSGFCGSFFVSPVELFRIKMQVQGVGKTQEPPQYSSSIDCAKKTFMKYGIRGVFQGLGATLFREIPAYVFYFGVYETLAGRSLIHYGTRDKIPRSKICLFGGLSGIALWLGTFPNDVIKSKIQSSPYDKGYRSIISATRAIYAEKGVSGFFNGIVPCLIRAPIINSMVFLTYEVVQQFLKKNNKKNK